MYTICDFRKFMFGKNGMSRSLSCGSWIYNYLCNQCLSPLQLWFRNQFVARCTRYNIMWYNVSATCNRSVVFSDFLLQYSWPPRCNWHIVESGVKHYKLSLTRSVNTPQSRPSNCTRKVINFINILYVF
jgi:hypothetical protein